jgi:hypothetical protein
VESRDGCGKPHEAKGTEVDGAKSWMSSAAFLTEHCDDADDNAGESKGNMKADEHIHDHDVAAEAGCGSGAIVPFRAAGMRSARAIQFGNHQFHSRRSEMRAGTSNARSQRRGPGPVAGARAGLSRIYGVTSVNMPPFTEMPLPFPVAAKPVAVGARPSKANRYKGLPS